MKDMNVTFKDKTVFVNSKPVKEFDVPIMEILIFEKGIAILLEDYLYSRKYRNDENVFFIDFEGNILWQIRYIGHPYEKGENPYVGLTKEDETSFWATTFDGWAYLVDVSTGNIIDSEFVK